jgi:N6-adenosine-specific RNA methylase IME4
MKAWGFVYKSQFVWVKNKIGLGFWNRYKHELLLIGTRGHIPAPAPGTQWASVIEAPVGKHSAKPDAALEMIESYYPNLPKIELHRRGAARAGMGCMGRGSDRRTRGERMFRARRARRVRAAGEGREETV